MSDHWEPDCLQENNSAPVNARNSICEEAEGGRRAAENAFDEVQPKKLKTKFEPKK
jgi:hypothetical protein